MFGISLPELIVIFLVALLIFGPEKLPEIAAKIGRFSASLKRTSDSFRRELYNAVYTPASEESMSFNRTLRTMKQELLAPLTSLTQLPTKPSTTHATITEQTTVQPQLPIDQHSTANSEASQVTLPETTTSVEQAAQILDTQAKETNAARPSALDHSHNSDSKEKNS